MSPFSKILCELRSSRFLRQKDLAEMLGYEQSYLSALEIGTKGPPTTEFVEKLSGCLALSSDEAAELNLALQQSERKLVIPADAPTRLYEMFHELRLAMDHLRPSQIDMILMAIRLPGLIMRENEITSIRLVGRGPGTKARV